MILLLDNGGQTCNQLWAYASALIHSIETGERICVLTYDKEIVHFPNLVRSKHFSFPLFSRVMHRCFGIGTYIKIIRRLLKGKHHNLYPLLIWIFRGKVFKPWDNLYDLSPKDYFDTLGNIFSPSNEIKNSVDDQFLEKTNGYEMIVGVHIRRGDYRFWQCGHYLFEISQYRTFCEQIIKLYPSKKLKFFISTNENITADDWTGIDYFVLSQSSAMKDLYCLSKCDLIVGPPSSFSRWAAFIGRKKLCFIQEKDQHNFIFKQVVTYGYFADGSPIWYNLYSDDKSSSGVPNHPLFQLNKNDNK